MTKLDHVLVAVFVATIAVTFTTGTANAENVINDAGHFFCDCSVGACNAADPCASGCGCCADTNNAQPCCACKNNCTASDVTNTDACSAACPCFNHDVVVNGNVYCHCSNLTCIASSPCATGCKCCATGVNSTTEDPCCKCRETCVVDAEFLRGGSKACAEKCPCHEPTVTTENGMFCNCLEGNCNSLNPCGSGCACCSAVNNVQPCCDCKTSCTATDMASTNACESSCPCFNTDFAVKGVVFCQYSDRSCSFAAPCDSGCACCAAGVTSTVQSPCCACRTSCAVGDEFLEGGSMACAEGCPRRETTVTTPDGEAYCDCAVGNCNSLNPCASGCVCCQDNGNSPPCCDCRDTCTVGAAYMTGTDACAAGCPCFKKDIVIDSMVFCQCSAQTCWFNSPCDSGCACCEPGRVSTTTKPCCACKQSCEDGAYALVGGSAACFEGCPCWEPTVRVGDAVYCECLSGACNSLGPCASGCACCSDTNDVQPCCTCKDSCTAADVTAMNACEAGCPCAAPAETEPDLAAPSLADVVVGAFSFCNCSRQCSAADPCASGCQCCGASGNSAPCCECVDSDACVTGAASLSAGACAAGCPCAGGSARGIPRAISDVLVSACARTPAMEACMDNALPASADFGLRLSALASCSATNTPDTVKAIADCFAAVGACCDDWAAHQLRWAGALAALGAGGSAIPAAAAGCAFGECVELPVPAAERFLFATQLAMTLAAFTALEAGFLAAVAKAAGVSVKWCSVVSKVETTATARRLLATAVDVTTGIVAPDAAVLEKIKRKVTAESLNLALGPAFPVITRLNASLGAPGPGVGPDIAIDAGSVPASSLRLQVSLALCTLPGLLALAAARF